MSILITPDLKIKFAPVFKVARRDRMRVIWLEDDLVYVARRGKGHGRYLVYFIIYPGADERVRVDCSSISGDPCHGQQFKGLCAHAAAAILRGQAKANKSRRAA
jgi:hypothetical protein